jgi:hypothetical protein
VRVAGAATLGLLWASLVLTATGAVSRAVARATGAWALAAHAAAIAAGVAFWASPLPADLVARVDRQMLGGRTIGHPLGSPSPGVALVVAAAALLPHLGAWALSRPARAAA